MTLTCPCCRASNETTTCRRCKADLALLAAVEERRAFHVVSAQRFAADCRADEALRHLHSAAALRSGPDLDPLRAVCRLLSRDYSGAIAAYDEMKTSSEGGSSGVN